jgi:hypothetical protein
MEEDAAAECHLVLAAQPCTFIMMFCTTVADLQLPG